MSDMPPARVWAARLSLAMVGMIFAGMCAFVYLGYLRRLSPLDSQRLISIEAASSRGHGTLIITREFCLAWAASGEAIRMFRRIPDEEHPLEEVYEMPPVPIHLKQGCHMRPRLVDVPDLIAKGKYIYQSGLRFCNEVRCTIEWLPPVTMEVDTFEGRHHLRVEPHTQLSRLS